MHVIRSHGVATALFTLLLASSTLTVAAQPAPVRVVQNSAGAFFVVQGSNAWPLVPDQISDDVFANMVTVGDEVDGTLLGPLELPPISGSVSLTSDGTLYYIQGNMGYPLVPDPIADSDLAALTFGSEIDGNVPRALWTDTTPTTVPATTDQPLAAVVPTVTTQSCTGVPTGAISGAPSYAPILAPCRMLTLGQPLTPAARTHTLPTGVSIAGGM